MKFKKSCSVKRSMNFFADAEIEAAEKYRDQLMLIP